MPARHPEQVRAFGHRLTGDFGHVRPDRGVQQHDPSTQRLGLLGQAEPADLATAGPRVHDQHRMPGEGAGDRLHSLGLSHPAQRRPRAHHGGSPQRDGGQRHGPQIRPGVDDQDGQRCARHDQCSDHPHRAVVGQHPPRTHGRERRADHPDHEDEQTAGAARSHQCHHRAQCAGQGQPG
ncbi:hypothetical protein JIW86_07295 [Streptomyces sp. NBC_00162]|nr:hypothetical protein JIW86_07295 [Streptomyces sp. NBC_00162]